MKRKRGERANSDNIGWSRSPPAVRVDLAFLEREIRSEGLSAYMGDDYVRDWAARILRDLWKTREVRPMKRKRGIKP
jgi:hypothetical protein